MKILFFLFSLVQCRQFIRNLEIPSCKNCIYFTPRYIDNDYTSSFSRCSQFGNKDIITDVIVYDFADSCRNDEMKCGKEGRFFEEEKDIDLKILKYQIISNLPTLPITIGFLFTIIKIILKLK